MLGAVAGVLGALMALEAIREIVGGFGDGDAGLVGRLLMIDSRGCGSRRCATRWDETTAERDEGAGGPGRRRAQGGRRQWRRIDPHSLPDYDNSARFFDSKP